MPLVPFIPGQVLTASAFNAAIDAALTTKLLFSSPTVNNTTTVTNATDLTIPVAANAWYSFESLIRYDTGTTPDIKIQLTGPTGTVFTISRWGAGTGATTTVNAIDQGVTTATTTWTQAFGGAGVGTSLTARATGYIAVAATSGNVVMGFAQNTANATVTTLYQGTWMKMARVL